MALMWLWRILRLPWFSLLMNQLITQIVFWTLYCYLENKICSLLAQNIRAYSHKYIFLIFPCCLFIPLLWFPPNWAELSGILRIFFNPPLLSVISCCTKTQNFEGFFSAMFHVDRISLSHLPCLVSAFFLTLFWTNKLHFVFSSLGFRKWIFCDLAPVSHCLIIFYVYHSFI